MIPIVDENDVIIKKLARSELKKQRMRNRVI